MAYIDCSIAWLIDWLIWMGVLYGIGWLIDWFDGGSVWCLSIDWCEWIVSLEWLSDWLIRCACAYVDLLIDSFCLSLHWLIDFLCIYLFLDRLSYRFLSSVFSDHRSDNSKSFYKLVCSVSKPTDAFFPIYFQLPYSGTPPAPQRSSHNRPEFPRAAALSPVFSNSTRDQAAAEIFRQQQQHVPDSVRDCHRPVQTAFCHDHCR